MNAAVFDGEKIDCIIVIEMIDPARQVIGTPFDSAIRICTVDPLAFEEFILKKTSVRRRNNLDHPAPPAQVPETN